jgi:ribonuclease D
MGRRSYAEALCQELQSRMTLLTTTQEIAELCDELAHEPFVALDTEFMRDRTYWPKLCLVQLAGQNRHAAIDPLAPDLDLAPLLALMANPAVVKVFHAARQDVEIFYHLSGAIPTPLFDTQLAAMVCGYGEEVGYETLVSRLAKARVDKSSRFTDWSRRPLTQQQLDYALDDVIHLRVIYQRLEAQLKESCRTEWVAQELAGLTDPNTYEQSPEAAWRRIKVRSRDPRFLAIVVALAAWREREAQRRDLPRNRIVRDDLLLELAANRPRSVEDIARLRRISLDKASSAAVVAAVRSALEMPEAELPVLEPPPKLPRGIGPLVELLRVLLKFQCEEHHVAQRLVATTADLEAIAAHDAPDVAALRGWRLEVFGRSALALKQGKLGLAVTKGQVVLVPMTSMVEPA